MTTIIKQFNLTNILGQIRPVWIQTVKPNEYSPMFKRNYPFTWEYCCQYSSDYESYHHLPASDRKRLWEIYQQENLINDPHFDADVSEAINWQQLISIFDGAANLNEGSVQRKQAKQDYDFMTRHA